MQPPKQLLPEMSPPNQEDIYNSMRSRGGLTI